MAKEALIGYTGFVGGNLASQHRFQYLYNSKNIAEIKNQEFDLVVCAGVSAVKWLANKEPEKDWTNIQSLIAALKTIKTKEFVLISTVDVYPLPINVDEDTAIDIKQCAPYGKHRRMLEEFVLEFFPKTTIIRLPGLFGNNLKKNIIYDFLHNNCLDKIHQEGIFQFYNLEHLWYDINRARANQIKIINFATEPVSTQEIAKEIFGIDFANQLPPPAPRYDFHTKYGKLYHRDGNYLYNKQQILAEMIKFKAASENVK